MQAVADWLVIEQQQADLRVCRVASGVIVMPLLRSFKAEGMLFYRYGIPTGFEER